MGVQIEKFVMDAHVSDYNIVSDRNVAIVSEAMIQFIQDFEDHKLPLVVRSQPVPFPAVSNGTGKELTVAVKNDGTLIDVVGLNFREIVLDPKKDVLVLIYSPFCGGSQAVMPLFKELAQELAKIPSHDILVTRFDKVNNDFPVRGLKITHFPSVYFFPAGDFDSADYHFYDYNDYNGSTMPHNTNVPHSHFTRDMLLRFMWEHGKNSDHWPTELAEYARTHKPELYMHDSSHDHDHDHDHDHADHVHEK
jgi:thiol-disulfide isomerase/thioredoxin